MLRRQPSLAHSWIVLDQVDFVDSIAYLNCLIMVCFKKGIYIKVIVLPPKLSG